MKKLLIKITSLCVLIGVAFFGGYKLGDHQGWHRGSDEAITASSIMACRHLTYVSQSELSGDATKARDYRNQLLFLLAKGLDDMSESKTSNWQTKRDARLIAQEVADHYWKHRGESSFSTQERDLVSVRPDFATFLQKYKRSE